MCLNAESVVKKMLPWPICHLMRCTGYQKPLSTILGIAHLVPRYTKSLSCSHCPGQTMLLSVAAERVISITLT